MHDGGDDALYTWVPGGCVSTTATGDPGSGPSCVPGSWMSISSFNVSAFNTNWDMVFLQLNGNGWSANWGQIPDQQLTGNAVAVLSMLGNWTPSSLGGDFSQSTCTDLGTVAGVLSAASFIPGIGEITAGPAVADVLVLGGGCL
jgi:hypothetical protein